MGKKYNKLVRDKIPRIIKEAGKQALVRKAEQEEYQDLLRRKLLEEVDEFMESSNPEELADIIEVVAALGETSGLSFDELMEIADEKREERGAFRERIVLLEVK